MSWLSAGLKMLGSVGETIGGVLDRKQDLKNQKEFAQSGIQWKVADAKKAGIHPLAALGAQTHAYQSQVGGGLSSGLSSMGQDISRAIDATRPASAKVDAYAKTVQDLNVTRMGLENELLGAQIAKIRQAGASPPMPTAGDRHLLEGQGDSPLVKREALEATSSAPNAPNQEPGSIVDLGYSRTPTGHHPVMSDNVKQRLEEDFIGSLMWSMRNRLGPTFGANNSPPSIPLGKNEYWWYSPIRQEYQRWKMRKKWWGYKHERAN